MKRKPIVFWNKSDKKIQLINPGDINISEGINKMNLTALTDFLGICDEAEVLERNAVLNFLFNNPDVRKEMTRLSAMQLAMELPKSENDFLYFYAGDKNPYWEEIKGLISKIRNISHLPKTVETFVSQLEADLELEPREKAMAQAISPLLGGVAFMEGTFSIFPSFGSNHFFCREFGNDIVGLEVFGYKLFSMSYSSQYQAKLPAWLKCKILRATLLSDLFQSAADSRLKAKAKKSSLISFVSEGVKKDLSVGFNQLFKAIKIDQPFKEAKFDFYFRYNSQGLCVELLNVSVKEEDFYFDWYFSNEVSDIKLSLRRKLKRRREKIQKIASAAITRAKTEPIFHAVRSLFKKIAISSSHTDADYKWYAIGHLYSDKKFIDTYQELCDQRVFFFETLQNLKKLQDILENFETKSMVSMVPLCIPTISQNHSGVFFKNLAPINLIGTNHPKIVPVTLERINGQMVGLTGRHGGGKTTIGKNVLQNVYLALSGLPVFAESFNTDIKTVLGAVTNDEGQGSTATVFVKKVANLMKEIKEVPVHESLIFIDEIGKGTQQDAGMELGKAILSSLSKGKNSVLFNTQILELAEYAQNCLNAVCYKANKEFEFTKGISGGEISELIKEVGLDKYLN